MQDSAPTRGCFRRHMTEPATAGFKAKWTGI